MIALTISNRSSDEAFIVHSVFVDYSRWLLSGASPYPQDDPSCRTASPGTNPSSSAESAPNAPAGQPSSGQGHAQSPNCGNPLQSWQQQTLGNQIDSVETRIVRGELLDRQPWTTRNWVLRALQAAGSIATGFTFVTSSQSWIRGIGAFNGSGIPAAQTLWPDATVGQMNRISDFGFQVNKVIAKESSDIIVAFFPIERFLPPDLASIFISYPAAFFAPMAAKIDPKVKDRLKPYMDLIFPDKEIDNMIAHLHEVVSGECLLLNSSNTQPAQPANTTNSGNTQPADTNLLRACQTADLVNRLSLNVVSVRVGGTMTVDVNKVPPQITEVDIDTPSGKDAASMWAKGENLTGVIRGSFLGGGTPSVTNVDSKVLQVKGVAEGSSDTELHFTITVSDNLPAGTSKLSFQVSKKSDGSTIMSATHDYTIDVTNAPPQITAVDIDTPSGKDAASMWAKGENLTGVIRGSFLGGGTPAVTNVDSKVLQVEGVAEGSSDTELHFTITMNDNLPAGTSKLSFQVSKKSDGSTITSATHDYTMQTTGAGAAGGGTQDASSSKSKKKPQTASPTGPSGPPKK